MASLGLFAAVDEDTGEVVGGIGAKRAGLGRSGEGLLCLVEASQLIEHPAVGRQGVAHPRILPHVVLSIFQGSLPLLLVLLLGKARARLFVATKLFGAAI